MEVNTNKVNESFKGTLDLLIDEQLSLRIWDLLGISHDESTHVLDTNRISTVLRPASGSDAVVAVARLIP